MKISTIVLVTSFLFAAGVVHAGEGQKKVCTIQLGEQSVSASVKPGFTAAVCPPDGKIIKVIVGKPNLFGWDVYPAKEPDVRFFVGPNKSAEPINLLITFSDESQTELVLGVDGPKK